MLKIRLQRVGKKNSPIFRIVLAEHLRAASGKFLEVLGFYNPIRKEKSFKKDRISLWLSRGVKLSPTIHNLFVREGVIQGEKVQAWKPKKKEKTEEEAVKETKSDVIVKEKADVVSEAKKEEAKNEKAPEIKSELSPKEEKPKEEASKAENKTEEKSVEKDDDKKESPESEEGAK
jgi:small subunit ribosomal protein S16